MCKTRLLRRATFTTAILIGVVVAFCWGIGIRKTNDIYAFIGMSRECHPVWKELALGRIYEGQRVEDMIESTNPIFIIRHGRFLEIGYHEALSFTGLQIIAKDGKLIRACAGSCTWDYTFFDSMSAHDESELLRSFETNLIAYGDCTFN